MGLQDKNVGMQCKAKNKKASKRPNEKFITLALFSSTWEPVPMTESIVQIYSVVFPGKIPHY